MRLRSAAAPLAAAMLLLSACSAESSLEDFEALRSELAGAESVHITARVVTAGETPEEYVLTFDGGEDGYDFYTAIITYWREALVTGGRLYFEVGIGQADSVLRIMRAQGFGDIQVVKDHHDIPRVVFGTLCTEI